MKILIVEDEELAAERLQEMVNTYDPSIEIHGPLDTIKEAVRFLQKNHESIDLILLDIQLADGKSFEIFNQIQFNNPVIFTTAYDEYAIDAFRLNSIDYLLKPISTEDLKKALDKFFNVQKSQTPFISRELIQTILSKRKFKERFLVKAGQRMYFRETPEIDHFFADDKLCYLTDLEGKKFLIDHTLEQLEDLLDPDMFFRVNRSAIVQLQAIREIRQINGNRLQIFTKTGTGDHLIVSRSRVPNFKSWLE
ncbi:LytR/AlgR family response regulator transcription factor [Fulvivirga sedimenti]|uniref:LytTR family DNA-binding domain-containing protein n=1 Tax=Fulvivirga sedimenti TaxID=2879465 RepID=A0A9X1HQ55_9BACT|nr:LytTR family DNA-binding domain-containing protein [Fulvivirga sedimenti]MCA6074918.1 LytTR family DNA-binding domain-containing protein [Fulvivirga sedimenti]MCA6076095.1 LytTR family DNA-binding domain-containing protein [Fulvivirga sedimenti]MCA6077223.1 LytTR family DNA-binding domain-containing protein [Fulvivirga sedimenti]